MSVQVGQGVADFQRTTHTGEVFSLSALRGRWVVIFFYPKDFTPGCTAQSCAFRDSFADLARLGAAVVGVSGDSDASHAQFAAKHALPYPLIGDQDGSLRKHFGVPRSLFGLMPGRVTYVIDPAGVCQMVFNSQLRATAHAAEAVKVIGGKAEG
jgi:peroxiredoxin Q/BCP